MSLRHDVPGRLLQALIRLEPGLQLLHGVMEVHLGVDLADAERRRDLGEGQVAVDAQEQHFALPLGEPGNRLSQFPALFLGLETIRRERLDRRRFPLLRLLAAVEARRVADVVLREIDDDAEEPRLEGAAAPSTGAFRGVDEGPLREILGFVLVACEAAGDGEHRALVAPDQRLEGSHVSRAKRFEELGVGGIALVGHET